MQMQAQRTAVRVLPLHTIVLVAEVDEVDEVDKVAAGKLGSDHTRAEWDKLLPEDSLWWVEPDILGNPAEGKLAEELGE